MDYDSKRQPLVRYLFGLLIWFTGFISNLSYALPNESDMSVWVNEAIVATYTFSAENFLARQKEIAKYFTPDSWIKYTKALQSSKLKESVLKNDYSVSAVALLPPTIQTLKGSSEWQATMPLVVLYKNKSYQQKQTLTVVITFVPAKTPVGVRGLAVTSFTATVTTPACRCERDSVTRTIV